MVSLTWMAGLAVAAVTATAPDGLTDPTRPVDYLPASAQAQPLPDELVNWRLTAVRIGKAGNSAVLNGKIVRVGDMVGRARISEIKPGLVVVELDRRQEEVRLHGAWVKKLAAQHKNESAVKP
jgi:MSHA biogenesis protein MshK